MSMQGRWIRRETQRVCRQGSVLPAVGWVLIAAGLLLLFVCVPGWAWAALAGILLVLAGYALLRLGRR